MSKNKVTITQQDYIGDLRGTYGVCGESGVQVLYDYYFKTLVGKCLSLFVWEGLPETVDRTYMESMLLLTGNVGFSEFKGNIYAVKGYRGGEQGEYYLGRQYTVANPRLGSKQIKIGEDGIVMYNSEADIYSNGLGLRGLIHQTATLLADNIISINCAQINSRVQSHVISNDATVAKTAEKTLKDKYAGKPYAVLTSDMEDVISVVGDNVGNGIITELTELQQTIMANFYNQIGIKMNAIRKKQRMITDEINAQDNYIAVSINEMLNARQTAVEQINEMFGTNITVSINPILEDKEGEDETDIDTEATTTSIDEPIEEGNKVIAEESTGAENDSVDAVEPISDSEQVSDPIEAVSNVVDVIEHTLDVLEKTITEEEVTEDETVSDSRETE